MDSQQHIYDTVKAVYTKTDIGKIDQSRDFNADLIVLLEFISLEPTKSKDSSVMDFEKLQVSVFNANYDTALTAAKATRALLEPIENSYIREVEFDDRLYIFEEDSEIHRFITRYTIHTK